MAEEEKIRLTSEGFKAYHEELNERKIDKRKEIEQRIAEARAQGDLSENSEYDEAKEEQGRNEARIREIEAILQNAEVIDEDEISKTKVSLGSTVVLRDEETKEETQYRIVSAKEENIFENKISADSPVGKALEGKKKNQVVEVVTGVGTFKYKIMKIGSK